MLTKPGTYYITQPYPGNSQINIIDFEGVETVLVVDNEKLDFTLYILRALGYDFDSDDQLPR